MHKKIWKDEEAVSPVIATILMVAITVVLAGVLVVYMQQFSQGPGDTAPQGSFVATATSNPYEVTETTNGGGWSVQVTAISGGNPSWGTVKVTIKAGGATLASMVKVTAADADISQTTTAPLWYLMAGVNGAANVNFCNPTTATGLAAAPAGLGAGEFETVDNATFIIVDNDGDGKMNTGDVVFVYKDTNGDMTEDIKSGYTIEFTTGGGKIGGTSLN